jgi:two-component system response regulator HydG
MRLGAFDLVPKPFDLAELRLAFERVNTHQRERQMQRVFREQIRSQDSKFALVGECPEMQKLSRMITQVAPSPSPVLIVGESGTGKELIARSIHAAGLNASRPFITVDCRALVPALMEIELFGQMNADGLREGVLTNSRGGTVYLDEISELPLELQVKLLRALQEKQARPVGSIESLPVHPRVLASSSRDLELLCEQGKFRRDLLFRLNVIKIKVPPLRERKEDIPVLVKHFIARANQSAGNTIRLSDAFLTSLANYEWTSGNVRELENCIERACNESTTGVLERADLPTQLQAARSQLSSFPQRETRSKNDFGIVPLAQIEKSVIIDCVTKVAGDKLLAAKLLGIGKTTLYRKLKEYADAGEIAHF